MFQGSVNSKTTCILSGGYQVQLHCKHWEKLTVLIVVTKFYEFSCQVQTANGDSPAPCDIIQPQFNLKHGNVFSIPSLFSALQSLWHITYLYMITKISQCLSEDPPLCATMTRIKTTAVKLKFSSYINRMSTGKAHGWVYIRGVYVKATCREVLKNKQLTV